MSTTTATFNVTYGGTARAFWRSGMSTVALVLLVLLPFLWWSPSVLVSMAGLIAGFCVMFGSAMRLRAKVVVGADGLLVSRVGTREFVPYGEIVNVTRDEDDVVVSRRGRPPLRFGLGWHRIVGRAQQLGSNAFVQRIEDARAACGSADLGAQVVARVARGDRSTRAWVEAIHALVRDPGYRDVAVLPEHMWRIVEDPSGDAATRAGAAVGLASLLDDEGRGRLRIAAHACAEPKLRVALETAADPEAEVGALEEALDCVVRAEATTKNTS